METALLILGLIETLSAAFNKAKANAKQSGELTPDQEAELDARMEGAFADPHWQPETP